MRVAAVLAHQIRCFGLSRGSGTPTFLVRLEPSQTVAFHDGPVISEQFIRETADLKEAGNALEAFQGPKPARKMLTVAKAEPVEQPTPAVQSKSQKIAAQLRVLAQLFEAD